MTSGRADLQRRICKWYLKKYYPDEKNYKYQAHVLDSRILPAPDASPAEIAESFFFRALPRIDLLIETDTEIVIVEAKSQPKLKDVSELIFYKDALSFDRRFAEKKDKAWKMVFVTVDDHKSIEVYCGQMGIQYIYAPISELPEPDFIYKGNL